jgi:4,5-DOPA dioxygenase extradiol
LEKYMQRLPTLFLSHGSPMHALDPGGAGKAWQALAAALPRPRAVLIASAHWETSLPMLTGGERLQTIHDFGGFPAPLYKLRYDAPGAPDIAQEAASLLQQADLGASVNACRGIDHGAWVPLRWMYPEVDMPVVQLSVQPGLGTAHHLQLGRALQPLTQRGVLVIGSGHVTHNLRDWMTSRDTPQPLPYVTAFAQWLEQSLARDDAEALLAYREVAPGAARAHPTEEHFLPLYVALGAAGAGAQSKRVYAGMEGAALSMDAYEFSQAA